MGSTIYPELARHRRCTHTQFPASDLCYLEDAVRPALPCRKMCRYLSPPGTIGSFRRTTHPVTERGRLRYKPRAKSETDRLAATERRTWDVRFDRSRCNSRNARHTRIPNCKRRGNSTSVQ